MPPHHVSWWSDKALRSIADLFGLNVIDVHHGKLEDIHKRLYLSCVLSEAIKNNFGFHDKERLIDRSLNHKIISKISSIGSRFLEKGLANPKILPNGHSLTVVYQKTAISN